MGEGWVVEATIRSFPDYDKLPDYHYLPLSATSIDGREPDDFQPRAQMKRMFHQHKLNPGEGGTIAEFSRNCIVPLKFVVKDYVDHLGQMKCVRKSEELKVKGRKRSSWKKITTTLNESNCIILTKYRRWKFMNLICTCNWYDMESCLRGRSQRKWHIYSTYRWQDLIRHYGERDFVKEV